MLTEDTRGYRGLEGILQITCFLRTFPDTFLGLFCIKGFQEDTGIISGVDRALQGFTGGYRVLQGVTRSYKVLQSVIRGYRGFERITENLFSN